MPVQYCLDYYSFLVSFELGMYESSNFVFFQDYFTLDLSQKTRKWSRLFWLFWVSCFLIWNLGSACQLLQRNWKEAHWYFDKDCVETFDHFGEYAVLTILCLLLHESETFIHLFKSYIFQWCFVIFIAQVLHLLSILYESCRWCLEIVLFLFLSECLFLLNFSGMNPLVYCWIKAVRADIFVVRFLEGKYS